MQLPCLFVLKKSVHFISGPHGRVNVMLVRGLFANFQIPIWYRYDHVLGKNEYLGIIKKIEDKGFHVTSTTCDMAKSNQKLATSLGTIHILRMHL